MANRPHNGVRIGGSDRGAVAKLSDTLKPRLLSIGLIGAVAMIAGTPKAQADSDLLPQNGMQGSTWNDVNPTIRFPQWSSGRPPDKIEVSVDFGKLQNELPNHLYSTGNEGSVGCSSGTSSPPTTTKFTTSTPKGISFRDGIAKLIVELKTQDWVCTVVEEQKIDWDFKDVGFGIKTRVPIIEDRPMISKTLLGSNIVDKTIDYGFVFNKDDSWAMVKMTSENTGENEIPVDTSRKLEALTEVLNKFLSRDYIANASPDKIALLEYFVTDAHFGITNGALGATLTLTKKEKSQ